jgi:ankyrin repeat protein
MRCERCNQDFPSRSSGQRICVECANAQPPASGEQNNAEDSRDPQCSQPVRRWGAAPAMAKVRTVLIAALLLVLLAVGFVLVRNAALLMAAKSGNTVAVTILLALGADVNAHDSDRRSALAWAATFGHDRVVRALLARGAPVEEEPGMWHVNRPGALLCAAREGHTSTLDILLARVSSGQGLVTLLTMVAATNGHLDTVRLLLSKSENPKWHANLCLAVAVRQGHSESVRVLLAAGADPNTKVEGESLSATAANAGQTEILQMLREAGAKE